MTNLPDKLIELWKEFKRVQVTCSIDDLGERNDYIRAGSEWNTVIRNLDKIQSYTWIEASVCQTVSWMNVYYVNDFIKFMRNRNLHVHLNYVYDPEFLSIKALPAEMKQAVLDRCTDLNQWELNSLSSQFTNTGDMTLYQRGVQYNKWLDNNNRTSFAKVFPEWYNILKQYESVS